MRNLIARLFANPALIVTAVAMIFWWVLTLIFPPDVLVEVISTACLMLCALGLIRWGPAGWRVFWRGARRPEDWGILAVDFIFLSLGALRGYAIVFRQLERPAWLQNSNWSAFFVYLVMLALFLFIAATRNEPPSQN